MLDQTTRRGMIANTLSALSQISPAIAPFFGGLLVQNHSWQDIYWLTLAFACLQFLLIFFIVPETLWIEHDSEQDGKVGADLHRQRTADIAMGREVDEHDIDSAPKSGRTGAAWMPWHRPAEYARISTSPILMSRFIPITIVSFYYGSLFAWSVGITVSLPQVLGPPPYSFSNIALGCSYLAFGIGSVLGKSVSVQTSEPRIECEAVLTTVCLCSLVVSSVTRL
jgi:MFS family permease